jgi:UDP-glucuronate 4-epimerase
LHKTNLNSSWADIAKAKRLLGWEPQVSLEQGIRKTVEWHQANRAWLDDIQL